ncbi:hypothetical protein GOP47_0014637 [Adiantum capillus-veneris]|uniref:Ubiquitin-like domain-containing protein n=1 Tax=Adiantum capillus-veneris TaxID=13818 RepID=A0A9D4ULV7_ADICA|nr:hypothetical protein GOP47_0014637 [Adiantum capillus-veneris]
MNRAGGDLAKRPLDADDGVKQWELRPGGMLVQKRDPHADATHAGPLINLRVSYGRMYHHVSITANSTFGDLKKLLVQDTRLEPRQQRLQYKGKERNDNDILREVGLKDKSKVVLVEDIASSEKRLIELRKEEAASKACKAVAEVQQLVDKLSGQVATVEAAVNQGKKLNESEFTGLTDLLMCQLLKLDASKVEGETNVKKRILTRRIQKYVETIDVLLLRNNSIKTQNGAPRARSSTTARDHFDANVQKNDVPSNVSKAIVSTTWENFGANYSTKVAPQVSSEPLLIEWD